jgi:hypothetical protein
MRAVAAVLRIRPGDPAAPEEIRLVGARIGVVGTVKGFGDIDAAAEQLRTGRLDVGDDEVETLGGAGAAAVRFVPNMTEAPEPGGVNCTARQSLPEAKSASSLQPSPP